MRGCALMLQCTSRRIVEMQVLQKEWVDYPSDVYNQLECASEPQHVLA